MRRTLFSRAVILATMTVGVFGVAVAISATPITGASKGDPARGKKVFASRKCEACHKADGRGGFKITGNPTPDWRDSTRMADPKFNDDYLRDCITNGKPKSGMVAWSKQGVKPAEIEDLIAYIHTFSAKKAAAKEK